MVILISGRQGAGKTTLTKHLMEQLKARGYEATPVKFAGPLYAMHDACLKILGDFGIKRNIVKDGPLLQLLGTEWGRKTVDNDIWVKLAKNRTRDILAQQGKNVVIIDDCRFENEFDAFPEAVSVRLECDRDKRKHRCEMWRENENHPSETGLDAYAEADKFTVSFDTGVDGRDPATLARYLLDAYVFNKK